MSRLNKEEVMIGTIFIVVFAYWTRWAVFMAPISGFLWALSGSDWRQNSKLFRRLGCPLVLSLSIYWGSGINLWWPILPAFAVLSLGYGIPSPGDKGSTLGRFFLIRTNGDEKWANIWTRGTIYSLLVLSYLVPLFVYGVKR